MGWTIRRGDGLPGKAPGIGGGRFSRRDALCASAWYGLRDARAFHSHPIRRRTAGGYRSHALVKPMPPFRAPGVAGQGERPCGVNSGMTPRVVFSEGRTLCVRVVRPNQCQGISFPPHAFKIALGPTGHMPRSNRCLLFGRAEPAPPRGGPSDGETAFRGKRRG